MLATRHQLLQSYLSTGLHFEDDTVIGNNGATLASECRDAVTKLMTYLNVISHHCYSDVTV